MKTDIEIAQEATMKPITQIAAQLGLADEDVIPYGRYKAKINHRLIHNAKKQGKLILVTAISPTPAGEGKTTTSVGLADAMNALGKKTMLCLREPSLGPVFGVKGGAAGGGYAQVVPMEDHKRREASVCCMTLKTWTGHAVSSLHRSVQASRARLC